MSGPVSSQGSIDTGPVVHDWTITGKVIKRRNPMGAPFHENRLVCTCSCGFRTGAWKDRDRLVARMLKHAFPGNLSFPGV